MARVMPVADDRVRKNEVVSALYDILLLILYFHEKYGGAVI